MKGVILFWCLYMRGFEATRTTLPRCGEDVHHWPWKRTNMWTHSHHMLPGWTTTCYKHQQKSSLKGIAWQIMTYKILKSFELLCRISCIDGTSTGCTHHTARFDKELWHGHLILKLNKQRSNKHKSNVIRLPASCDTCEYICTGTTIFRSL